MTMGILDDLLAAGIDSGLRAASKAYQSVLKDVEVASRNKRIQVQKVTPPPPEPEVVVDADYEEELTHG